VGGNRIMTITINLDTLIALSTLIVFTFGILTIRRYLSKMEKELRHLEKMEKIRKLKR
jgi:hypothetical protein